MKTDHGIRGLSVALLLAAAALPARATSFSAELVDTVAGTNRTGPFSFQDKSYRFETVEGGQTLIVIGDGPSGIARLLVPPEKLYLEAGPDEPMSRMMSPFAFFSHYARLHEVRAEGTEAIDGVPCTKRVAFSGEQVFATAWFSAEHDFPLKVEVPILQRTVELRNITPGPQDAALFAVPADYKAAPGPEETPTPGWAAQVPNAPLLSPPFEKAVAEGEIIRIRPQPGRHIRIQATNPTQGTSAFTSLGFKDGRPLSDVSGNTMNLNPDDVVTATHTEMPAEADDIVVRVRNGTVTIKAEFVAAAGAAPPDTAPAARATSPPPDLEPDLSVGLDAPDSADMASRFEVTWSGPGNKEDYIAVARPDHPPGRHVSLTRVREGNPIKLWAPGEPGDYEVRYVLARGTKVLAKAPITINAVTASVAAVGPVKAASRFDITWKGPGAEGDYITVARREQAPGAFVERTPVRQGNPVRLHAPGEPGDYEMRYILGRGTRMLASAPIIVDDVTATVEAPATATAGKDFEVRWTGPANEEDVVVIARPDQAPGANVGARTTRAGNPLKLRAPKEPGVYEVRYLLGRGKRLLAKTSITITPATGP